MFCYAKHAHQEITSGHWQWQAETFTIEGLLLDTGIDTGTGHDRGDLDFNAY